MPEPAALTRLTLLPTAPRERGPLEGRVRRYRLASVPTAVGRDASDRFAHLKRAHD